MPRGKGSGTFWRALDRIGMKYTKRQLAILCEEIPLESVRLTELAAIKKRARERCDELSYEIAEALYQQKNDPHHYRPSYTLAEAKYILQQLTPWEIHWDVDISEEQAG